MSGGSLYHRRLPELAGDDGRGGAVRVGPAARRTRSPSLDGPAVMLRDGSRCGRRRRRQPGVEHARPAAGRGGHARLPPLVGSVHQVLGRHATQEPCAPGGTGAVRPASVGGPASVLVVPSERLLADPARRGRRPPLTGSPSCRRGTTLTPRRSAAPTARPAGRAARRRCSAWPTGSPARASSRCSMPSPRCRLTPVTLHLAGDENVDADYRAACSSVSAAPTSMVGRAPRDRRHRRDRRAVRAADVFALPSTEEPYGIVYGEAMAAGFPVVGWAAGNLPNLVDDRRRGLRRRHRRHRRARRRARRAAPTTRRVRAQLGAAGRERAARLPTWDESAAVFFAVCRDAAAER